MKGKLIVIEGNDGSGKSTQLKLLTKHFDSKKISYQAIKFPRYEESFHGRTVRRFLDGEFGEVDQVSPYLISLAYSLDRATAKRELNLWLKEGKIILADRYVPASLAHQAAKLPEKKREDFLSWLYELEYKINRVPKESLVIFLYVPVRVVQKLMEKRGDKLDIHEASLNFLTESEKMYLRLAKKYKHWVVVECVDKNGLLKSREEIHEKIVATLKKLNII